MLKAWKITVSGVDEYNPNSEHNINKPIKKLPKPKIMVLLEDENLINQKEDFHNKICERLKSMGLKNFMPDDNKNTLLDYTYKDLYPNVGFPVIQQFEVSIKSLMHYPSGINNVPLLTSGVNMLFVISAENPNDIHKIICDSLRDFNFILPTNNKDVDIRYEINSIEPNSYSAYLLPGQLHIGMQETIKPNNIPVSPIIKTNNYTIIKDEKVFKDFIDWLPDLNESEQYYLQLLARNKYCTGISHIKSDKAQLKRITSTKDRMFWKVKQLECELDSYRQKTIPIPQEALALYIMPNPRDLWKATINSLAKLSQCIKSNNRNVNPEQECFSEIQKAASNKRYVVFDIDTKEIDVLKSAMKMINEEAISVLETRGGYHMLIEIKMISDEYKNTWYNNLRKMDIIDSKGDNMIPVPGCIQGGFMPRFIITNR